MKYINHDGKVRILVANKQPFKGVENYYTDAPLYMDPWKVDLQPEVPDSNNEVDTEPEPAEDCA